jgi:hypothetical protein
MTPLIDSLRTTQLGQSAGSAPWVAAAWLVVITVVFALLAHRAGGRPPKSAA